MADAASGFSYEPLQIEQVRWYWNKQPFNLKGAHRRVRLRCRRLGLNQSVFILPFSCSRAPVGRAVTVAAH